MMVTRYLDVAAVENFTKILKFRSANTLFYAQNISYLSLEILCICYVTLHSVSFLVMHISPLI